MRECLVSRSARETSTVSRTARDSGVYPAPDQYGRRTVPGINHKITERRLRQLEKRRREVAHRPKNGIHDPITFYQLIDAVLNIKIGQQFTSKQLADWLNEQRPQLTWDPVTVGRVLNDICENLEETNGVAEAGIASMRDYSGRYWMTTDSTEGRIALLNLLDDLYVLTQGEQNGRLESPLNRCASILRPMAAMAG